MKPIIAPGWRLTTTGEAPRTIVEGEIRLDFRGESFMIVGGKPPHKPSSTGRVWAKPVDHRGVALDGQQEYYPGIFKLKWEPL